MNRRGFLAVLLAGPVAAVVSKNIVNEAPLPICFGGHLERIEWQDYGPDYVPEHFLPAPHYDPRTIEEIHAALDAIGKDPQHPMCDAVTKEIAGRGFLTPISN